MPNANVVTFKANVVSFEANVTRSGACGDHSGMATVGARNRRSQRGDSTGREPSSARRWFRRR